MANTALVTSKESLTIANSFIDTVSNSFCYMFIGDHVVHANVESISDSADDNDISPRRNMIAGKLIQPNDLSLMIRYVPYESDKVFDMWDDQDSEIASKDF